MKYPENAPPLTGSKGTDDDKHLGETESRRFIADTSLIIEEKLDGTNLGIHLTNKGDMVLQCRGHLITEGMHPQYDLFKQWAAVKRPILEEQLSDRFILFGEWVYARHSVHYRQLPHYFFEFDIYDKQDEDFLSLERRLVLPGRNQARSTRCRCSTSRALDREKLGGLIGPSCFDSVFENPLTNRIDHLMEGLYLRTEAHGVVTGRAKYVRPEFVEKVKQSEHWQYQSMTVKRLKEGAEIWS